ERAGHPEMPLVGRGRDSVRLCRWSGAEEIASDFAALRQLAFIARPFGLMARDCHCDDRLSAELVRPWEKSELVGTGSEMKGRYSALACDCRVDMTIAPDCLNLRSGHRSVGRNSNPDRANAESRRND